LARIAGVDIPRNKRVEVSLTYIFGIGRSTSNKILGATGIDRDTKVKDLTEEQVAQLRAAVEEYKIEGELRKEIRLLAYFLAQPKNFLVVFTGGGKKYLRTRIKFFLVSLFLAKDRLKIV